MDVGVTVQIDILNSEGFMDLVTPMPAEHHDALFADFFEAVEHRYILSQLEQDRTARAREAGCPSYVPYLPDPDRQLTAAETIKATWQKAATRYHSIFCRRHWLQP